MPSCLAVLLITSWVPVFFMRTLMASMLLLRLLNLRGFNIRIIHHFSLIVAVFPSVSLVPLMRLFLSSTFISSRLLILFLLLNDMLVNIFFSVLALDSLGYDSLYCFALGVIGRWINLLLILRRRLLLLLLRIVKFLSLIFSLSLLFSLFSVIGLMVDFVILIFFLNFPALHLLVGCLLPAEILHCHLHRFLAFRE